MKSGKYGRREVEVEKNRVEKNEVELKVKEALSVENPRCDVVAHLRY